MKNKIMQKLKIGVIGAGYLGKFHAEKYSANKNVQLVGIADINFESASKTAAKQNTKAYADYKQLIGKVDAVSIVVPTNLHFKVSLDFLSNGISTLIEKPITTTLKEADQLINIAKKTGAVIQTGHLERFNPAIIAVKDKIKEPQFIEAHRLSFYKKRGTEVSVILDLMIHDIDIIFSFINSQVKKINAAGASVISNKIDIANARFQFENGAVANLTASRISAKNERKMRIFQQNQYTAIDFGNKNATNITIDKNGKASDISPIPGAKIEKLPVLNQDALYAELDSFVNTILFNTPCVVDGNCGRKALKAALEVIKQIK